MKAYLLPFIALLLLSIASCGSANKTATADDTYTKSAPNRGGAPGRERITSDERIDRQVQELTTRLDLSKAQQKQIREIAERYAAERAASRGERDREAMRAGVEKQDAEITAVLDDKQKAEYEKLKAERREEMRARRGQRGGPGRGR